VQNVEETHQHGGDQRENRQAVSLERTGDGLLLEPFRQDHARTVDRGAEDDGESPDVVERQAREPSIPGIDPQPFCGGLRACELVCEGQPCTLRSPRGARRKHDRLVSVEARTPKGWTRLAGKARKLGRGNDPNPSTRNRAVPPEGR
jgi:hypothetical protein